MAPIVATLSGRKNRRVFASLAAWESPPGWEELSYFRNRPTFPSLRPGLLVRELGDDLVIHDPATDDIHSLNRPAAAILLLANGARTFSEIASLYGERFELPADTAASEVEETVMDLIDKKVLVARDEKTH
jgi:hypothetical protein